MVQKALGSCIIVKTPCKIKFCDYCIYTVISKVLGINRKFDIILRQNNMYLG